MAKIKFFTNTMMVISNLKTETIKKHYKYGDKLELKDNEDRVLFKIEYKENSNEALTKFGAVYNTTTPEGYAAMTIKDNENFNKEKITVKYGEAIGLLNQFEEMIKTNSNLDERIKNIEDTIEEVTFFNDFCEDCENAEECNSGTDSSPEED